MEATYNERKKSANEGQQPDDKKRTETPPQMRAMFSPDTIDEEKRTVEVVFGSENPTRMFTWEHGPIMESLSFSQGHVRMERLNSGAPLLDNHDAWGSVADIVVGVVERAWAKDKKGYAKVRFAKGEKGDRILEMVRDGVIRNISVGYRVNKYEVTRATERGELDFFRAVDWEPHEISLVAVPADHTAQVRSMERVSLEEMNAPQEEEAEKNKQQIENQRSAQIRVLLAQHPNT